MIEQALEIAKHLGMQGLVLAGCGYYIMYLTRTNKEERESQRDAHSKEREEWKTEKTKVQDQLIDLINRTNDIDSSLTQEISLFRSKIDEIKK